jgi:hypothetical protein
VYNNEEGEYIRDLDYTTIIIITSSLIETDTEDTYSVDEADESINDDNNDTETTIEANKE